MSPTFRRTGVLLVSCVLAIGLWNPSTASANHADDGGGLDLPDLGSMDPDLLDDLDDAVSGDSPVEDADEDSDPEVVYPEDDSDLEVVYPDEDSSPEVFEQEDRGLDLPDLDSIDPDDAEELGDALSGGSPLDDVDPDDFDDLNLGAIFGRFTTWGSGVNVRSGPSTDTEVVDVLTGPTEVEVSCQVQGELVSAEGYTNDWWAHVPDLGGYVSNIYVDVPEAVLPGVPDCMEAEQDVNPSPEPHESDESDESDDSTTKDPRCSTTELSYDPLDDRHWAELALGSNPYTGGLLTTIWAANKAGYTVTFGGGLASSLGIGTGSGSVGVYFGPDGEYGHFRSHSIGMTTSKGGSISAGFEEAIFFGGPELLSGRAFIGELSGNLGFYEGGVKAILPTDLDSINGLAVSVGAGINPGTPASLNLSGAIEWTKRHEAAAIARSMCDV